MNKNDFSDGDIVNLCDGRVFRVVDTVSYGDHLRVDWIDGNEDVFIHYVRHINIESITKPTPEAVLTFNAVSSLHKRLNSLNKI